MHATIAAPSRLAPKGRPSWGKTDKKHLVNKRIRTRSKHKVSQHVKGEYQAQPVIGFGRYIGAVAKAIEFDGNRQEPWEEGKAGEWRRARIRLTHPPGLNSVGRKMPIDRQYPSLSTSWSTATPNKARSNLFLYSVIIINSVDNSHLQNS
ncbi:hypothetical protein ALUC_61168S [Aspergillus luchuensis]|nr:hypothetical protein ALUC_61168S [Aspergillus luchuensis]